MAADRSADDRTRFEELVREVVEPVRRFLARRTDAATADDVLADVLLVCWRRLDDVPEDPLPWVYGVARLCLANARRGQRRQERVAARISVVDRPVEAAPEPPEVDAALHQALASLEAADAEVLRLWAWEQLTAAEIATVLDVTPNAASVRLHRAKSRLRDALGKTRDGAGHEETTEGRSR